MSSNHVRQSIINRMIGLVNLESWGTHWLDIENNRTTPPAGGDFFAVEFIGSDEEIKTTGSPGNNTFRETGDFLIHYVVESNTGADLLFERLEIIRSYFRFTIIDNVTIDAVNPPDTSPGASLANANGNWFGGSILISYTYDIRG
jgi:hypothetical protein